jgi:hypothetical protein
MSINIFGNGILLPGKFDLASPVPLDSRLIVNSVGDLNTLTPYAYAGLEVWVVEEKTKYQYSQNADGTYSWNEKTSISTAALEAIKKSIADEIDNRAKADTAIKSWAITSATDGTGLLASAANTDDTTHAVTNKLFSSTVSELKNTISGMTVAHVYATRQEALTMINGDDKDKMHLGDSIFIVASGEKDLWISGGSATTSWEVSDLETKFDLSTYYTKADMDTLLAGIDAKKQNKLNAGSLVTLVDNASNNTTTVNVTIPVATSEILGGIKTGFTASGASLPIVLDGSDKAYTTLTSTAISSALGYTPADKAKLLSDTTYIAPALTVNTGTSITIAGLNSLDDFQKTYSRIKATITNSAKSATYSNIYLNESAADDTSITYSAIYRDASDSSNVVVSFLFVVVTFANSKFTLTSYSTLN